MRIEKVDQANQLLPDVLFRQILKTGLVICGGKGTGKSNAGKVLASEIIKRQPLPTQLKAFDIALNWRWEFEPIFFQEINEKTRFVYDGKDHVLFDIDMLDEKEIMQFIIKVVRNDYLKQRKLKKELGGNLFDWKLYLLEETQSSMSRFALMRREGRVMLKMISDGRNMNQSYIIIGQRLSNMSTSLVERCHGYLFSKMIGDNDLSKIRRICGRDSGISDEVKKLADIGEHIYFDGSSAYKFNCPKYKTTTQPKLWEPTEKDIKKWEYLWGKRIL